MSIDVPFTNGTYTSGQDAFQSVSITSDESISSYLISFIVSINLKNQIYNSIRG